MASWEPRRSGAGPWTAWTFAGIALLVLAVGTERLLLGAALLLQVLFATFFVRHFAFAVSAMRSAPLDLHHSSIAESEPLPSVSVLVACKNEESVVDGLVASLMALDYPRDRLQVMLVNDGSSDRTGAFLERHASSHPHVRCIHRPANASPGKSAALNSALAEATGEILVVFDADHQPRPDVVRRLVSHFRDPRVGAVQGRCEIGNANDSLLSRLVAIDYFAGYLVNEYGRQSLFRLPAYGGANSAVRRASLLELGGWNEASVTEDTDLTVRLLLRGQRVRYDVNAVDREEGVVTLQRFWRQRYRWARGHQQVWRDYHRQVWRSHRLTLADKVETTLFLLVFHVPVASALGLVLFGLWAAGLVAPISLEAFMLFWTMMFLGPLLELGAGLLVSGADRRMALAVPFFLPLFFVSATLCTKAWIDGVRRRPYGWAKTARARDHVGLSTAVRTAP